MGKVITGPWKPENLRVLIEREAQRLLLLVKHYKQLQADEKKEGAG